MATSGVVVRPFDTIAGAERGWLTQRFHMDVLNRKSVYASWGALQVFNDDIIAPRSGFPPHSHQNIEVVSYLHGKSYHPATGKVEGGVGIRHRDNTGSDAVTEPGDVQVMSVGSDGVVHSEHHADETSENSTNLFQIWITPNKQVTNTTWGTRHFPRENSANKFSIFASGFEEDQKSGALPINSLSRVSGVRLQDKVPVTYSLDDGRLAYAVVISGTVEINGKVAGPHDGIAVKDINDLVFKSVDDEAEVLLVDTHP